MGAYILDGMRFKEGAFVAVWSTLAVANLALAYNTVVTGNEFGLGLALLALLEGALALFLTGLWATLQFNWIQLQYPAVVLAFEKLLVVGCIPVAATVQAWGAAAGAGMHSAPFFLAAILCGLYYLFGLPMPSSFHVAPRRTSVGGAASSAAAIQGNADGFAAGMLVIALPAGVYAAIHSANLFQWVHLWSILLLSAGPLLFLSALPKGLWWLGHSAAADALRRMLLLIALAAFLAGVEGRIVFHSFGQYIQLAAPWNYVAMTIGLYGTGALALLNFTGAMGEEAAGALLGPVLMVSSSVGALVLGFPAWVLPAPLLSAAGLALFYDSRSFRDYIIFIVGALATGGWFMWHHFWFLDVQLDGMPVRALCMLLFAAMAPAIIAPGLVAAGARGRPVEVLLLAQAALMTIAEERLFAGDHTSITYDVHPMFPAFLVVATSGAGLALARRLENGGLIGEVASYALQCVYGAKLAMLVVPEARLTVPVLGVALAVAPPLLLQKDSLQRRRSLAPWQGLALAAAVGLSVVAARFAIFDMLRLFLNRRPSEALAAGSLLLAGAAGCTPLVSRYYPASSQAKRALLLTAVAGMLLALLRPPLPISGGAKCPPHLPLGLCPRLWDEGHAPEHEEDDVTVYGDGLRRREHWPLWLLAGAAFFGLVAATSPAPVRQAAPLRLAQAAASAALVGGYMALDFFPGMPSVQLVVGVSALLVAAATVLLQMPARGGAVLLLFLSMAWIASLPVALIAQAAAPLPPIAADMVRLYPDSYEEMAVDEERREAVYSAVLASFAAEALLLAFALKLRVSAAAGGASARLPGTASGGLGVNQSYIDKAAGFLGQCMPQSMLQLQTGVPKGAFRSANGGALQQLAADGMAWVPTACNLVTLLCFGLCYALNVVFTGGDDAAVLLLAPILLLLCQDPVILRGLTDRRRYFPPVLGAVTMLAWSCASLILGDVYDATTRTFLFGQDMAYFWKNSGILVLCMATQTELLRYLWAQHRVSAMRAVVPGVVATVGVVWGDLEAIQVLAGMSGVAAAYLAASARQTKEVGRKLI